ncbi:unnamed protein product [Discula destructiva]
MVGVPRSNGCRLCVKRRVKCDQARPACGNCLRYGADCPGYDKARKFVDGKHAVRSRKARPAQPNAAAAAAAAKGCGTDQLDFLAAAASASDPDSTSPPPPFTPLTNQRALTKWTPNFHNYGGQATAAGEFPATIPAALKEQCIPFVYNMMGQLFTIHSREEVVFTAPWFGSILNYLGTAPVLDSAICAYMLQLVGKAKRDPADIRRSRDIYGQSLGALQIALNHPVAWQSTETLAATVLCSIFEMFAGTQDPLTWMLHVSGVSKLIEARGPASFRKPIDKSLLRHARPMIVTKAIFAGHDCFLNERKWRRLFGELTVDESCLEKPLDILEPGATLTFMKRSDTYFSLQAKLPPVIRASYNIRKRRALGIEPDSHEVARLKPKAAELLAAFISWHDSMPGFSTEPVQEPSADPTSPYDTVLKYRNPWEGSIRMSYWASLLILQECLNQCHPGPGLLFTNNHELASKIMRSLEDVGRGLMGPHRVGYPLRVAHDFVDEPTQTWTLALVTRYNATYAAMSADVYPANPALDHQPAAEIEMQVQSQPFSWID